MDITYEELLVEYEEINAKLNKENIIKNALIKKQDKEIARLTELLKANMVETKKEPAKKATKKESDINDK